MRFSTLTFLFCTARQQVFQKKTGLFIPVHLTTSKQILAKRGSAIRGPVEYWVKYQVDYRILGEFLSKKVKFLLESGEKKNLKMGFSPIFIWLWPINCWKHEYLGLIWLDSTTICHIRLTYRCSTQPRVDYRPTIQPTIPPQILAE